MDSAVPTPCRKNRCRGMASVNGNGQAKKGHPQVPFLTALVSSQIRTRDAGRIAGRTV